MNHLSDSEKYMQRCLQIASIAEGECYPNPMVGSIIVHEGEIIGEGYHKKAGGPHAEVNAIRSVKDPSLLKNSTIYVNLEPCAHYGKTPPCSKLIIEKEIPHVVIGCVDSFSEVAGKGIEMMKKEGIKVESGILEKESRELNRRFFTYHEKKRPFIILKWAQTMDGFIDIDRTQNNYGKPTWITNNIARRDVHKQRSKEQAILVGTHTAIKDNPSLTVRDWAGKNPLRLVIDKSCQLSDKYHLLDNSTPTVIYNNQQNQVLKNTEYKQLDKDLSITAFITEDLYKRGIQSVIIEGGAKTIQSFIDDNLWDEAHIYTGEKWFKSGVKAPILKGHITNQKNFENSKLFVHRNNLV